MHTVVTNGEAFQFHEDLSTHRQVAADTALTDREADGSRLVLDPYLIIDVTRKVITSNISLDLQVLGYLGKAVSVAVVGGQLCLVHILQLRDGYQVALHNGVVSIGRLCRFYLVIVTVHTSCHEDADQCHHDIFELFHNACRLCCR